MQKLLILAIVGFAAQLVDGALGMGYGLTSTSLLLLSGIAPAVASASVHIAEVVTTAASGVSHMKFGNVDKELVWKLVIPGSIGAFSGACFLSSIPGEIMKPFVSTFLILLGLYVLLRFLVLNDRKSKVRKATNKFYVPLGFIAGFFDATGGGGWGPIATPSLMAKKELEPRKVIGSVAASEFAVAASSSIGFILVLGWNQVNWLWAGAIMIGGIFAAPFAAWLVKIFPAHLLGIVVSGMLILTNIHTLLKIAGISSDHKKYVYIALVVVWISCITFAIIKGRQLKIQNKQSYMES
ncbi:putative membrane protein YfcA [Oikeobacillus pervagus]|uniref:Probable membrane transporter protein n=1 Tax=Oikeobacillus pervagus TaxID=1325931 RepID=A0AAJ1T149_9BACI|nr:sulfite exporter TauE/SafE family protein [Oikeobacillus pervagus]MDQ0214029.1 putative membrane protein YfcA [Oikeobacillus pervagus]